MARLLVVDDDHDTVDALSMLLELHGHVVCRCYSGAECLQVFPEFQPQAVLLDLWMPGLDGIEVARRLHGQVPVILITGVGGDLGPDASLFACRLMKPAQPAELLRVISLIEDAAR